MKSNPQVDLYLTDGCGRCNLYATPECKVHSYTETLDRLRSILLETELTEELKWKQPCYTLNDKNVLIMSAFKEYCFLAFFKGSLMTDPEQLMRAPGPNSQASRQLCFTTIEDVERQEKLIRSYVQEAIEIEKKGLKVDFKEKQQLEFPEELKQAFHADPLFSKAFESLTPGRQRSWNLHYSSAKQTATRESRIKKSKDAVLRGKGWNER